MNWLECFKNVTSQLLNKEMCLKKVETLCECHRNIYFVFTRTTSAAQLYSEWSE